jgi:predicted polyphosphate/ATP-dependent NAD kinase
MLEGKLIQNPKPAIPDRNSIVGIVANPASGKDIRRLVAHGSVFDNNEKSNILQRILLALDALEVDQVSIMPDYYGLGERALSGLKLSLGASMLEMPVLGNEDDSTEAGRRFKELGAGSIIVLGGDGTNRVVAKGCGAIPLVSLSTGTNNVFSNMIEGTVAGLAAGLVAHGKVDVEQVTYPAKRLEIYVNQEWIDMALVDAVACSDLWIGARAIWDPSHVQEIVMTQARPGSIGMSAIGACLYPVDSRDGQGLHVVVGQGETGVLAPIAPGLVTHVDIREYRLLNIGDEITLNPGVRTIALDGERAIEIYQGQTASVRLTNNGPRVVNIQRCMAEAANAGIFQAQTIRSSFRS